MKVRLPKHREFLIKFEDKYEKADEAWEALNQIVKDYSVDGKSIYTETFIEDNEDKVKALQEKYEFTYEIIEEKGLYSSNRTSGHRLEMESCKNHRRIHT